MVWNVIRMNEDELMNRLYEGRTEGEDVRERLQVKEIERVDEYWQEC